MSKTTKNKTKNNCPFCSSSNNGYESKEALKTHITLFHPQVDIETNEKTQHIKTKDSEN